MPVIIYLHIKGANNIRKSMKIVLFAIQATQSSADVRADNNCHDLHEKDSIISQLSQKYLHINMASRSNFKKKKTLINMKI